LSTTLKTFTKPALSVQAQIAILKARGLSIADESNAQISLRHIGYYRLSAYMRPFQIADGTHNFNKGATFEKIFDLYSFDRKLRIVFLDALDRIEIGLKSATTESLATKYGPHWYLDKNHFLPNADHAALITSLKEEIGHSDPKKRAVHIDHYYSNYNTPDMPPSWMLFEAISFGSFAYLVRKLNAANSKGVAWLVNIPEPALPSWCLSLSYLRNLCAHSCRIWNRTHTIKPIIIKNYKSEMSPNDKTYAQAVTLWVLLKRCSGPTEWKKRLADLFNEHPDVDLPALGFPTDWSTRTLWR
jgi:abortive infection bacteriophage resistance protein